SRKSFIWKTLGLTAEESLAGSLAAAVYAIGAGARILRVHDVAATLSAVRLIEAVREEVAASC
ncbi:MAG: dihydropteroate synthase, partial [Candidatus Latescibacteria bacterium]|nr:dihydropteroate synthase [Candidatus Latescibacterota bacterium]